MTIALAATLHDATGALAGDVRERLATLCTLHPAGVVVATSPPTAASITRLLADAGVHAGTPATNERGPLYRRSVEAALATGATHVHYLDFDRALHWLEAAPGEPARVLRLACTQAVLLVGRTEGAHRSHQRPLWETERVANRTMAARLGWAGRVDGLVPSFVLARAEAERLLRESHARDEAVYGEWLALLATGGAPVAYVECDGLDWETPDRDRAGVAAAGLAAWRAAWDTPAEWALRSRMAETIMHGFDETLARTSAAPQALLRLALPSEPPGG